MIFRWTIRDWMWFSVVMGLAIGWGMHARNMVDSGDTYPNMATVLLKASLENERLRAQKVEYQKMCDDLEGIIKVEALQGKELETYERIRMTRYWDMSIEQP